MTHMEIPMTDSRRYSGVLGARMLAFCVDYLILALLMVAVYTLYVVFGVVTLGLGFLLAPIPFIVVACLYFGLTMGGSRQASFGMRMAGLKIERDNGEALDFLSAVLHQVVFWAFNTFLSPLVLLIGLFTNRSRLLHDLVMGTVMHRA